MVTAVRRQEADLEAIREFSDAISTRVDDLFIDRAQLRAAAKSAAIRSLIDDLTHAPDMAGECISELLGWSNLSRRSQRELLVVADVDELASALTALAPSALSLTERTSPMRVLCQRVGEKVADLPFELAHFADPNGTPLLSRWVFDPDTESGALALICNEGVDLYGADLDERAAKTASVIAYLHSTMLGGRVRWADSGPWSMDIFLGLVYGVYMTSVLEMRMSKEFTKILPNLGELAERVLGIYESKGGARANRR